MPFPPLAFRLNAMKSSPVVQAWVVCISTALVLVLALCFQTQALQWVKHLNHVVFLRYSGLFLYVGLATLFLMLLLCATPFGGIRFGGPEAQPVYRFRDWVAMLFCAGMGVALILWGGAEPLFHLMHPITKAGVAHPPQAMQDALAFSYLHWTFHPWAFYALSTVATSFFVFNKQAPMHFRAIMLPDALYRREKASWFSYVPVHMGVLLTFIGGIAVSFAVGVLQVKSGLRFLMPSLVHWPDAALHVVIVGLCYLAYMSSALGGLGKGIKALSQWGVWLNIALFVWIAWAGREFLHLETLIRSVVQFVVQFIPMSLGQVDYADAAWPRLWTVKTWAFWLIWAPFMGMFGALISYGRTLRQTVLAMMLVPSLGSLLWFWVLGEIAIGLQQRMAFMGPSPGWDDMNAVIYRLLEALHTPGWIQLATVGLITLFFVNSADSATYSLATLGDNSLLHPGQAPDAPKRKMQFLWGTALALLAFAMVTTGGLEFLQELVVVLAFPYLFLYGAMGCRVAWQGFLSFKTPR
jgi:glycine betaine transporter